MDSRTAVARLSGKPVQPRARWPYAGAGQARLLCAGIAIIIGSVLPWVDTAVGTFNGLAGAGVWTLYVGVIAVGAAVLRRPRLVAVNALVVGGIAVGLTTWQGLRILTIYQVGAIAPSIGLVMVFGAGVFALLQVRSLWRHGPPREPEPTQR